MRYLTLILLFSATITSADVYRTVDEYGNIMFTDNPDGKAEKIEVETTSTYSPVAIPQEQIEPELEQQEEFPVPNYRVTIASPAQNESFWSNDGTVNVSVDVQPELSAERGDMLIFKLDGQDVGAPQSSPNFTLSNLDRGSHIIVASIIDNNGNVLKTSKSILFHLQRRSLLNNRNTINNQLLPQVRPAKAAPNAAINKQTAQ